ncbi:MAG: dUTP diphosphatase [Rhodospirillaceae bacterium]|nr:dUTP diphosphatase [Rhodospirillaceae bacterium]|tara:strand:- start:1430 stop:1906 length:477 start_codon:yes stop_codon:yes gene_type:complete
MASKIQILTESIPGNEDIPLPFYGSSASAGADLHAAIKDVLIIQPRERRIIPTGIKLMIPDGYEGQIRPRSGIALKHGVTVLNSPGTIDSDYRGEIGVLLINHGSKPYKISRGERIAQLIIAPYIQLDFTSTKIQTDTERGEMGFGSTGVSSKIIKDK